MIFEEDERNNVTAVDMLDCRVTHFLVHLYLCSEVQGSVSLPECQEGGQDVPSSVLLLPECPASRASLPLPRLSSLDSKAHSQQPLPSLRDLFVFAQCCEKPSPVRPFQLPSSQGRPSVAAVRLWLSRGSPSATLGKNNICKCKAARLVAKEHL